MNRDRVPPGQGPTSAARRAAPVVLAVAGAFASGLAIAASGVIAPPDADGLFALVVIVVLVAIAATEAGPPARGAGRLVLVVAAMAASAATGLSVAATAGAARHGAAMERRLQQVPVAALAGVLGSDETTLMRALNAAGYSPVKPSDSPADIAARSGRDGRAVLAVLALAAEDGR